MSAVSRRQFLQSSLGVGVGLAAGVAFPSIISAQDKGPIKVGVLHSLSGTMAISEVSKGAVVARGDTRELSADTLRHHLSV
jgi:urea transport system substrate-binding protein